MSIPSFPQNFRRRIFPGAKVRLGHLFRIEQTSPSKICNFHFNPGGSLINEFEQDVLWFQVSMQNVVCLDDGEGFQNLPKQV
jgi:hypothetical protein